MTRPLSRLAPALAALALGSAPAAAGPTLRVAAGGSIAAALERAEPGTVIEVEPGTYHEALTVDTPGITLRGLVRGTERPVLDGRGRLNDGVLASGSPFTMTGFEVRHYKGNGVAAQGVEGVYLSDLVVDDTGLYGVYPIQSSDITVTHCTITRISDAGIYVGQSNRAVVAYNELHHNVAGIEIENTNDALVHDNLVYENTAGILVFVLPNKLQKEGLRSRVFGNWSLNNNTPNFGDPNSIIGRLPPGLGIMVLGADDTIVEDNRVKGNDSLGIAVARLERAEARKDERLEPFADRNQVRFNYVADNGRRPHPSIVEQVGGGADLAWDGTGEGNCASLPDSARVAGTPLPPCPEPGPAPAPQARAGTGTAAPAALPAAVPEGAEIVRIRGMRFEPRHLEVPAGATVTWINEDGAAHTVTSGRGALPTRDVLDSPFLGRGESWSHTFGEPGRYEYLCLPHAGQAGMREATVTVTR